MAAFATVTDLEQRWRPLSATEQDLATVKLDDASEVIRAEVRGVDAAVEAGTISEALLRMVVCDMVKRAMIAGDSQPGVTQQQESTGPFSQSMTFSNPMGDLYLTKAEKRRLGVRQRAFTIDPTPVVTP
jgi:hypothetical protein